MIPRAPLARASGPPPRARTPSSRPLRVIPDCEEAAGDPMLSPWMPPRTSARPARPPRPTPRGTAGPRRLRRRPDDGHIAGVCAGVAEYFNVDPLLVRIAAVVLVFSGPGLRRLRAGVDLRAGRAGAGALRRATAADRPHGPGHPDLRHRAARPRRERHLGRLVVTAAGLALPARAHGPRRVAPAPPRPRRRAAVPTPRASAPPVPPTPDDLGVELARRPPHRWSRPRRRPAGRPTASADPTVGSRGARRHRGRRHPSPTDPTTVQPTTAGPAATRAAWRPPPAAPVGRAAVAGPRRWVAASTVTTVTIDRHRHRHRHLVGPGVFGVLLIWTGVAWLTGVGLTTGLAVGLVILGLGFVLGSFVGGSRALIFPALLVAVGAGDHRVHRHPVLGSRR